MNAVLLTILIIVIIIAAITDVKWRRIPNFLTLPVIAIMVIGHGFIGGWQGLQFSCAGMAVGFFSLFFSYLLGGMGAGDVKLMAGVGAALGWQQTLEALLFIALCGGLLAIYYMVRRGVVKRTFARIFSMLLLLVGQQGAASLKYDKKEAKDKGIPFGLAICCGVLCFFVYNALYGGGPIGIPS